MKKVCCLVLSICLLCVSVPQVFGAEALKLDASWSILLPAEPTSYETFAAEKLAGCLEEVFGARPATLTEPAGRYIALGEASEADVSEVAVNGCRITAKGGNLHIAGTGARGLQTGVYRFLEEFCGRKVYTSSITVLPAAESISVPADTDLVYEPFFEYADTDWKSPHDLEYSMANGLTGGTYRYIPEEMGGSVDYLGGFCHTVGGLCETAQYAETHPEYLALHDGVRTTDQPCLTNPDVLRICTENVLALLSEKHDPDAPLQIVSVTQNDNYGCCQCENCTAFEQAHGGVNSATTLNFVNQVADAVKAAGYDNVAVDTFAYLCWQAAPENLVPRDNVIVRMCPIFSCYAHPFDHEECNGTFMKDLEDWSKICKRIYIWDYATNYSYTCTVFPNFGVIQKNMQILYEHNVKGVYVEGNYYMDACDTEFGELRAYMISKCLQDPYCDLDSEINGFLAAYYGPGWKHMRMILDNYIKYAGTFDGHACIYYSSWSCMRPLPTTAIIDTCWRLAKKEAAEETQLANIERSELSWRWYKANAMKGEFSVLNPMRFKNKEQLYHDLLNSGVTRFSEFISEDLTQIDPDVIRYEIPDRWHVGTENEEKTQKAIQYGRISRWVPIFGVIEYFWQLRNS